MERGTIRTLDEDERRRIAARLLAPFPRAAPAEGGAPRPPPPRSAHGGTGSARSGRAAVPRRGRRRLFRPGRAFAAAMLDLPAKAGFPAAFCAAAAAWSLAVVAALAWSGVLDW